MPLRHAHGRAPTLPPPTPALHYQTALGRDVVGLLGLTPGADYLGQFLSRASAAAGAPVPAGCVVRGRRGGGRTGRALAPRSTLEPPIPALAPRP
jgi:hypothetical protein